MLRAFQGKTPRVHETAFVEDSAHVIGDVELGAHSSIWFQCVVRADVNHIRIGHHTNVQDGSVIHVNRADPVEIGDHVTLGHAVRLHGARVGSHCLIAIGAIVLDGRGHGGRVHRRRRSPRGARDARSRGARS